MTRIEKVGIVLFLALGMICFAMPALAQEVAVPPMLGEEEETDIVAGKVTALDVTNNTLVVTNEAGKSYTLLATKEETSIWKGDDTIELPGLSIDDPIELEYYRDSDGKLVAIWIDVLTKEVVAIEEMQVAVPEEAPTPVSEKVSE